MFKTVLIVFCFQLLLTAQIKFDADFESGNLNNVTTTDSVNYSVTTKTDIGGRWFYFRMTGIKDKYVRVTVTNSDVKRAMYSYDDKLYQRFSAAESPSTNVFQKTYEHDTVYVAYYTPYNYSFLQERISLWEKSSFVEIDTLGFTDRGFPIQEIRITDPGTPVENKSRVWIHARTHPSETPSSWHFEGIVKKLLTDNEVIDFYRKNIVFHLIPFTNPDGVYYGRSRTNYDYIDVERSWDDPEEQTISEVKILKARMQEINDEKVMSVFLNLHSQASPYCTFWIHTAQSTSDYFYRREYQFSNLNTSDNPYFVQSDYRESALQKYFPEGWLWSNHGESVMALTYETPYDRYSNNVWVTNENLYELGYRTVYSIAEFLELSHPKHLLLDNKFAFLTGEWNSSIEGLEFYSDDYLQLPAGYTASSAVFMTGMLEPGKYDVYGWWQTDPANSFNTRFQIDANGNEIVLEKTQKVNGGQWNFLTEAELTTSGEIKITVNGSNSGAVVADAFRIIYRGSPTKASVIEMPKNIELFQNYPNPFNPSTTISFKLEERTKVQLRIFNSLGQLIDILIDNELPAGEHKVIFDSRKYSNLASGIYYYNLVSKSFSQTKAMVLTK